MKSVFSLTPCLCLNLECKLYLEEDLKAIVPHQLFGFGIRRENKCTPLAMQMKNVSKIPSILPLILNCDGMVLFRVMLLA